MRRFVLLSLVLLAVASDRGSAQTSAPTSPNDSLFRRARRLVSEGQGTAGRSLVDSLLRRETEGSTGYGDALYWRGALAETAAEAERDYRRVIVEYPVSLYADDALLAIAELEQARGDRVGALQHLQRFVREHPVSSARGIAALAAARLAFEQRDTRTGCAMIAEARASASTTDVELRNQIDYFTTRCVAGEREVPSASSMSSSAPVRVTPPAVPAQRAKVAAAVAREAAPKTPAAKTPTKMPTTRPEEAARATTSGGSYTIQLAAYSTRPDADRLIAKLAARGVKARVSGATKPFRVRLDLYPTRQAAQDEVAALRARGIIGFVTTETPRPEGKVP